MSDTAVVETTTAALARLHEAIDALQALDLNPATDDDLLEAWREPDRGIRRLTFVDHRL